MTAAAQRKVMVAALGNPDRGDDGLGPCVAQQLAGRLPAEVALQVRSGDPLAFIDDWAGCDALVCVDAAECVTAPGTIHRIDLAEQELPRDIAFTSSHALGLADAIALARTLHSAPRDIVVYAVEGVCFDGGAALTPAVATAAKIVADCVVAEVERLCAASEEDTPHA